MIFNHLFHDGYYYLLYSNDCISLNLICQNLFHFCVVYLNFFHFGFLVCLPENFKLNNVCLKDRKMDCWVVLLWLPPFTGLDRVNASMVCIPARALRGLWNGLGMVCTVRHGRIGFIWTLERVGHIWSRICCPICYLGEILTFYP